MNKAEMEAMLKKHDDALYKIPEGSPTGTEPLIAEIRHNVVFRKRTTWSSRVIIWAIPILSSVLVAGKTLIALLKEVTQ